MYILESIQEFDGKKIGIYAFGKSTNRAVRKASRVLLKKGTPIYAIFIFTSRLMKGTHNLYLNFGDLITKKDESDNTKYESTITI